MKKVLIVVVALIAIYFIMAFIGPSGYRIERQIKIGAEPQIVFDQTSVYANWAAWSPWAKLDPNAKYEFGETEMSWDGNPENVGKGKMVTTKVEPNKEFLYDLIFMEPWQMTSHGGFTYEQQEDSVLLTWFDEGEFGFFSRPMMLFMDLEEQIGPQFEQGLADIKKITESMKVAPKIDITEAEVESMPILYITESSNFNSEEIGAKIGAAYGEIMALIGVAKLEMAGAPLSITTRFSQEEMMIDFNPAIPVAEIPEDLELSGRVQKGETYAGKVLKTFHVGSYENLHSTYEAIMAHIQENGYEINGNSWEEYIDDPTKVDEEELRTIIYFPIK